MERLARIFVIAFIASFASLSLWAAEAKTPEGHPIGSAGFNDMLGKQIKPGTLSLEEQSDGSFLLTNKLQTVSAHVTHKGVTFDSIGNSAGKGGFSLKLGQWGREDTLQAVRSLDTYKKDEAVYHTHTDGLAEKFSNTSGGIQQDFIVTVKPQGSGDLHIRLQVSDASVKQKDNGAIIALNSGRQLTYDRLNVTDAAGKTVPAEIRVAKNNLLDVIVHDADAQYPIVIDPTVGDANWIGMGRILGSSIAVKVIAISGSTVYSYGNFTAADGTPIKGIAKWNGSNWSVLPWNLGGTVTTMVVDSNGNLYTGGIYLPNFDGAPEGYVSKWNGSYWSMIQTGLGGINPPSVDSLAVDANGTVYAGGSFTGGSTFGPTLNYIAQYKNGSWSAMGAGMNGEVKSLAVDGSGNVYAGGSFTTAGGVSASGIAKWNGSSWSAMGSMTNVKAVVVDNTGAVYVVGSSPPSKWNGSSWVTLGTLMFYSFNAMAVDGSGNLYVGGNSSPTNVSANNIAKWDGNSWSNLGSGTNGQIYALAVDSTGNLYAGGSFSVAGGIVANNIAEWNGNSWSVPATPSALAGIENIVQALAVDGNGNVYAGGEFYTAGAQVVNHIAKWDGNSWSALGSGINGWVLALVVDDNGNVYAGGSFTIAGGVSAYGVAKWDGNSWNGLGTVYGMLGNVYALVVDAGGNIYVGSVIGVSKWDGNVWSHPGGVSFNNIVNALALDGNGNLYAGGQFTKVGSLTTNYIAKWDGNSWSALGSGSNSSVYTLVTDSNGNLYAGVSLTAAGGVKANGIAKWNGSNWVALGSGVQDNYDGNVNVSESLALDKNSRKLYVGGSFDTAGGKPSINIAQWLLDTDDDSVADVNDAFPYNAAASVDSDGDGYPDYWNEPLAQTLYGCTPTTVTCNGLTLDAYPADGSQHLFPAGTYPNPAGTGGYVQAPAGSYAINGVLSQCAAGTFTSTAGNSSCTPAPAGSYVSSPGATSATQCAVGTFQASTGATSCSACPTGTTSLAGSMICHKVKPDFNGNLTADILMRDSSSGNWQSFLMGYNANIASSAALAINASGDYVYQGILDANGDGTADVLTRKTSTGEWVLWTIQNNAVTNTTVLNMTTDPNWSFQAIGDFNGDGTDDILIRHTTGYWFVYFLKNGQMYDWGSASVFLNADFVLQAVGDMTGDGIADALLRSTSTGKWYLYNAATGVTTQPALWASSDWQFQTLADLNGDGIQDVVLRVTNPLATYPGLWGGFIMNSSGNVASSYVLSSVWMNLGLQLAASGDYNGDGTGDLLIRNTNTGAYYLFTTNPPASANAGLQTLTSIPALNGVPWSVLK